MPIFMASLSLTAAAHDYSPLWAALKNAHAQHVMDTTWLIDVSQDAVTATNALLSHCVQGDKLFVLEFVDAASWTGTGLSDDAKAWLALHVKARPEPTGVSGRNPPRRAIAGKSRRRHASA